MARQPETGKKVTTPRQLRITRLTLKDLDARKDVKGGAQAPAISNGRYRCSMSPTC
jgi:hypothetical protein